MTDLNSASLSDITAAGVDPLLAREVGFWRPYRSWEQLLLVGGMDGIEAAQHRVLRQFGGPDQVASAIGLGLREIQQFSGAARRIAPHKAMQQLNHRLGAPCPVWSSAPKNTGIYWTVMVPCMPIILCMKWVQVNG